MIFWLIQENLTPVLNETSYPFFPSKLTDIIQDELEQFWKHKVVDVYSKEFSWIRKGYDSQELMVTWLHAQDLAQDQTRGAEVDPVDGPASLTYWQHHVHSVALKMRGICNGEELQMMGELEGR